MPRIAICAPSTPLVPEDASRILSIAQDYPDLELVFHEQCYAVDGHFAGADAVRLGAFVECANDPAFDAVWFARGGYGANRIAQAAVSQLGEAARDKAFLGYSDGGYLLAELYHQKKGRPVHAPMAVDSRRKGGEEAVRRVFAYLSGDMSGLEPSLNHRPTVAFNLMTLAMLCGTGLAPDLTGHVVMVEEVSEHLYAIDRLFFHVSEQLKDVAGLKIGRFSDIPENDREFGALPQEIAQYWCERTGIPFLGTADIGHDAANKIVPFGLAPAQTGQ